MTNEEIDKWVEDHIKAPENSVVREAAIQWGKIIAHKFYELGCKAGFDACKQSLNMY